MTKLPALAFLAVLLAALGAFAWLVSGEAPASAPIAELGVESPTTDDFAIAAPLPTLDVRSEPRHFAFVTLRGNLQDWPDRCVLTVRLGDNDEASIRLLLDLSVCADERVWQWLQETP